MSCPLRGNAVLAHLLSSSYVAFESFEQLLVTYVTSVTSALYAQWLYPSA